LHAPGSIFGEYRLERCVAQGSAASVWLAARLDRDERAALKLLAPAAVAPSDRPAAYEQLIAALAAAGRLKRPGLQVTLDPVRGPDGLFGLASQWLEGGPILPRRDLLRPGVLDEQLRLLAGLAEVLGWLHLRGIAHGNVKPGNVLVTSGRAPSLVLVDLVWTHAGLSRRRGAETPEGGAAHPASDQWCAARLLHAQALEATPGIAPAEALGRLPVPVLRVLKRALAPDPAQRFPDLPAFAAALEQARVELEEETGRAKLEVERGRERGSSDTREIPALRALAPPEAPTEARESVRAPTLEAERELRRSGKLPELVRQASLPRQETRASSASIRLRELEPPRRAQTQDPTEPLEAVLPERAFAWSRWALGIFALAVLIASATVFLVSRPTEEHPSVRAPTRDATIPAGATEAPAAPERIAAVTEDASVPLEAEAPETVEPVAQPARRDEPLARRAPEREEADPPASAEPQRVEAATRIAPADAPARPRTTAPPEASRRARRERECRPGDPQACFEAGVLAEQSERGAKRARAHHERACDERMAAACAHLAALWASGRGGAANARTAEALRRRACALGHAPSCEAR
jgi:hypothetical protein